MTNLRRLKIRWPYFSDIVVGKCDEFIYEYPLYYPRPTIGFVPRRRLKKGREKMVRGPLSLMAHPRPLKAPQIIANLRLPHDQSNCHWLPRVLAETCPR
jgi:hypothetical protein